VNSWFLEKRPNMALETRKQRDRDLDIDRHLSDSLIAVKENLTNSATCTVHGFLQ